jgi:hypothetical protein
MAQTVMKTENVAVTTKNMLLNAQREQKYITMPKRQVQSMPANYITVMFLKAWDTASKIVAFGEHLAHASDWNYSEVHAELVIGNTAYAAVYNEKNPDKCIVKHDFDEFAEHPLLEFVHVPVKDAREAKQLAERIWGECKAYYWIPVAELALPGFCVHDLGDDPATWDHLYCSQFVLLFLKLCAERGMLALPREAVDMVMHCNSVTCTPAHLKRLLDQILII